MKVENIMTKQLISVESGTHLVDAHRVMAKNSIRHLVVTKNSLVVGIISEFDIQRAMIVALETPISHEPLAFALSSDTTVDHYMEKQPIFVPSSTSVLEAIEIILDKKIGSIIVGEPENTLGIITETDLLELLMNLIKNSESNIFDQLEGMAVKTGLDKVVNFLNQSGI